MALDPAVVDAYSGSTLRGFSRQQDWSDQTARDMHDVMMADHRCLTAAIAREVAMAPNSQDVMNQNTAARTPTTLDHYALGAGPSAPGAPAGANASAAGK